MRYEVFFTTLLTISYAYVLINTTVEYIKLLDNSQGIVTKNKNDTEGLLFKKERETFVLDITQPALLILNFKPSI